MGRQRMQWVRMVCTRSIFTQQVYHGRTDSSQEVPGLGTEARREAGVPHDALNGTSDREKDAGCVCFLVQERML